MVFGKVISISLYFVLTWLYDYICDDMWTILVCRESFKVIDFGIINAVLIVLKVKSESYGKRLKQTTSYMALFELFMFEIFMRISYAYPIGFFSAWNVFSTFSIPSSTFMLVPSTAKVLLNWYVKRTFIWINCQKNYHFMNFIIHKWTP